MASAHGVVVPRNRVSDRALIGNISRGLGGPGAIKLFFLYLRGKSKVTSEGGNQKRTFCEKKKSLRYEPLHPPQPTCAVLSLVEHIPTCLMSLQPIYQRQPPHLIDYTRLGPRNELLAGLTNHVVPYNPGYARKVLQRFLDQVPTNDDDDDDGAFELLGELLATGGPERQDEDVLGYMVGPTTIWLKENPHIISGQATTGLRTWEAAVYLTHYLWHHQDDIIDRRVLELGAGTGLVGLLIAKWGVADEVFISDGTSSLIERMGDSMALNNINADHIHFQRLWWGEDECTEPIDTIVGADITYDALVVPALVHTIRHEFARGATVAYIAATIRNHDTIAVWDELTPTEFEVTVVSRCQDPHREVDQFWYPPGTPEIRIYKLTPK